MRVSKPTLHPMARAALIEIQGAGVEVTPDIVLWVQDAATKIASEPPRPVTELVDWPTPCGGALLYPLSFGAVAWLMRLPKRLQDNVTVLGFAAANSFKPEVFNQLTGTFATVAAVMAWSLRLKCSPDALAIAVDRVLGCAGSAEVPDLMGRTDKPTAYAWGGAIKALCAKYGESPDYWMWRVSREKAMEMLHEANLDLPDEGQVSEYETEANNTFYSIVESIKAGTYGG